MSRIEVTESELVAELRASVAPIAPPDAQTLTELAEATGFSRSTIKSRLAEYRAAGRLEVYRVSRVDTAGNRQMVPAYRIKPAGKTPRKRTAS